MPRSTVDTALAATVAARCSEAVAALERCAAASSRLGDDRFVVEVCTATAAALRTCAVIFARPINDSMVAVALRHAGAAMRAAEEAAAVCAGVDDLIDACRTAAQSCRRVDSALRTLLEHHVREAATAGD